MAVQKKVSQRGISGQKGFGPHFTGSEVDIKFLLNKALKIKEEAAAEFLAVQLDRRPSVRGLEKLIDLRQAGGDGQDDIFLRGLRKLTDALQVNATLYTCSHCGFAGRSMHWQCPGCRRWDTVRPTNGAQGI